MIAQQLGRQQSHRSTALRVLISKSYAIHKSQEQNWEASVK